MVKKKNSGLQLKLIGVIVPVVLVIIIAFFLLARDVVMKVSRKGMDARAQVNAGEISAWTGQIVRELNVYKDTIETGGFRSDSAILAYLETTVEKNESYPVGLYMGDDRGIYLDGSGWVPGPDWVLVERDWYVNGRDKEEFSFGEPYYDSMTGQMCVSVSARVDYDSAVRVLATDVYLDYVSQFISDMAGEHDMGVFLVTGETRSILAHPDAELTAQTLGAEGQDSLYVNIAEAMSQKKEGIFSLSGDEGKYEVSLNKVDHTDWYLVSYISERQMLADLRWMEMYMVILAVMATAVLIVLVLRVTGRVVKPVVKITDLIGQIADGDFSQNIEVSGNDEVAVMSSRMQQFISGMRNTIQEISNIANRLDKQSTENAGVSASMTDASRNQTTSTEQLNQLAAELSNEAKKAASQMDTLAELIQQMHESRNNARDLMRQSVEMSQSGRDNMENISAGMESINHSMGILSAQVSKVGDAMEQIEEMVDMIINISAETNLLALNASIEAARAGEAGRGFAVVAEQIGKLAANSNEAADSISKLTAGIGTEIKEAIANTGESVAEVEKNVGTVSEARETFVALYEKVEATSQRVEEMVQLIGRVDDVAARMGQITDSQSAAAAQIVRSAIEAKGSAGDVDANSRILAENAESLKKESMKLAKEMSRFKINNN